MGAYYKAPDAKSPTECGSQLFRCLKRPHGKALPTTAGGPPQETALSETST